MKIRKLEIRMIAHRNMSRHQRHLLAILSVTSIGKVSAQPIREEPKAKSGGIGEGGEPLDIFRASLSNISANLEVKTLKEDRIYLQNQETSTLK